MGGELFEQLSQGYSPPPGEKVDRCIIIANCFASIIDRLLEIMIKIYQLSTDRKKDLSHSCQSVCSKFQQEHSLSQPQESPELAQGLRPLDLMGNYNVFEIEIT